MTDFKSLKLAAPIDAALDKLGYTTPTPIQQQAIPDVLRGRDLMGLAQTGTGKTAAFSLPMLHHIATVDQDPPKRGARVLILAPTRELASQIAVSVRDYGQMIEYLSVLAVFGGAPIQKQIKRLVQGVDVLVATPGRLIDLIERKALTLSGVEILILDEADQMMDMGFIHALKKIVPLVPDDRQTLFFSATMVPAISKLAQQFLTDPVKVSVAPANTTAERVTQQVTFVNKNEKVDLLTMELMKPEVERALVFTRTKHGADRVVKRLEQRGLPAIAIHGNKSQGQRQRALAAFREGKVNILVATDIAARGIDIENITHVVNYEIPNVPEQYVHRIGRTARASAEGKALSFVGKDERSYLKSIQKLLKIEIPVVPLPEGFNKAAADLKKLKPVEKSAEAKIKPETPARKGRGKSKKKGRYAKSNKAGEGRRDAPQRDAKPKEYKKREHPKRAEGESRAQRKAKNQAKHAAQHSRRAKPDNNSETKPKKTWSDKPEGERTRSRKPQTDKKRSDKPRSDRARGDKPNTERSGEARKFNRKPKASGGKPESCNYKGGKPSGKPGPKSGGKHPGNKNQSKPQGKSYGKPQSKSKGQSKGSSKGKTKFGGGDGGYGKRRK